MRLESIKDFLQESDLHTFFPTSFPTSSDVASIVNVSGGTASRGGVYHVYLRIVTRETHPNKAINKSHEIKDYMYQHLKGAFFNGKKIINVETDTPEPLPIGEENGLYSVSWNYTIIEG